MSDQALIDALRDRIADLRRPRRRRHRIRHRRRSPHPEHPGPWLKPSATPTRPRGRKWDASPHFDQITRHDLDAGWRPDEGDDQ